MDTVYTPSTTPCNCSLAMVGENHNVVESVDATTPLLPVVIVVIFERSSELDSLSSTNCWRMSHKDIVGVTVPMTIRIMTMSRVVREEEKEWMTC